MRTSNGQFSISVSDLQLRLPVHEAPGTVPGVTGPKPPVQARAHGCVARPYSRIARRRTRGSRHGLTVSGTAGEHKCATASAAKRRRQRLARVYVMVYRRAARGRCQFVERTGGAEPPALVQASDRVHGPRHLPLAVTPAHQPGPRPLCDPQRRGRSPAPSSGWRPILPDVDHYPITIGSQPTIGCHYSLGHALAPAPRRGRGRPAR